MHAGSLEPDFLFQLTHGEPARLIPDLHIQTVNLFMGREGGHTTLLGPCDKLAYADVVDPDPLFIVGPVWSYSWVDGQTARAGHYDLLAQIVWDTSRTQFVPNDGAFPLEILKS